jgi:hypothetical protein
MNKDDMELFGKLKVTSLSPDVAIILVDRKKAQSRTGVKYVHGMIKKHSDLVSIKECRVYQIIGCSEFYIAYASSKKEELSGGFDNTKCMKTISNIISNYADLQFKNLKAWNSSTIERIIYEGTCYYYCVQMRKEMMCVYKFLHASILSSSSSSSASSLMDRYNRSKEIAKATNTRKFLPGEAGVIVQAWSMKPPKKWYSHTGYLEKLLFLKHAKIVYEFECPGESSQ